MRPLAVVVGAGVSGLTCAVRLLEAGWDVHVVARERPEATVSLGAGAIWEFPPARAPAAPAAGARDAESCAAAAHDCSTRSSRRRKPSAGATATNVLLACAVRCASPRRVRPRRALASLAVFDALHAAAETTGVHVRRVHYLYRDAASAPAEARARLPSALLSLTWRARGLSAAVVVARRARLQARFARRVPVASRCADASAPLAEATTCRRRWAPASAPATATWRPWCALLRGASCSGSGPHRARRLPQVSMQSYLAWLERCVRLLR